MLSFDRFLHLAQKYDQAAPRYTSYPTVPAWKELEPKLFGESLQKIKAGDKLSLYFHLPFCENLCHFCGCMQVITKDHSKSAEYLSYLLKEIEKVSAQLPSKNLEVNQVHFGGGTPNFFKPDELQQIMNFLRERFQFSSDCEIAIEMHPRTSTKEFCEILPSLGFNRISLGVQDLDPHVQKLINRHQTYEMTKSMIDELRALGFSSFNMDLIYGLPGQTESGWADTLSKVLGMKPNRLAVYSYAHVPWMRPVQRTFEESDLPTPIQKLKNFYTAYELFLKNGYSLIGMDHFALETDELHQAAVNKTLHRNFMGYSTRKESHQIGFGVSSISYVGGNYFQNKKKLPEYYQSLKNNELAHFRGALLTEEDHLRRQLITDLMCHGDIDLKNYHSSPEDFFKKEINQLQTFVDDGLLVINGTKLKVMGEGFLFLRNMAACFDPYLEPLRAQAQNSLFSRTI